MLRRPQTQSNLSLEYILEKLDELAPIIIHDVSVTHLLEMTMVDGKVATILSDKSNATTSCSI